MVQTKLRWHHNYAIVNRYMDTYSSTLAFTQKRGTLCEWNLFSWSPNNKLISNLSNSSSACTLISQDERTMHKHDRETMEAVRHTVNGDPKRRYGAPCAAAAPRVLCPLHPIEKIQLMGTFLSNLNERKAFGYFRFYRWCFTFWMWMWAKWSTEGTSDVPYVKV